MIGAGGCGFPRPTPFGGMDARDDGGVGPFCTANQALRCDGSNLVRCNRDGTAEVSESCSLGCSATDLRCHGVNPSNGLAQQLDMAAGEPDFDLGATATINTDDGTVLVDGNPVAVKSVLVAQSSAPIIRVFLVHSLTANDVTITGAQTIAAQTNGRNALAIVSDGELKIGGVFAASADVSFSGAGEFPINDSTCKGSDSTVVGQALSGAGGGGFGGAGASGGTATNDDGSATGGTGGTVTGNPALVPLRGGCDSAKFSNVRGRGGGAIQLVSRTRIIVSGVVAANGSSYGGGGSGGGILLEAPVVEVSGGVVANGGAGSGGGCILGLEPGEDGRLDAMPATGGLGCTTNILGGNGGNGGARNAGATMGASINATGKGFLAVAGSGGGGVGRIRVNTVSGGLHTTGVFSPNPSTGPIGSR
jgi:hypothetical protein